FIPPPPRSTLFPYTTLFRSLRYLQSIGCDIGQGHHFAPALDRGTLLEYMRSNDLDASRDVPLEAAAGAPVVVSSFTPRPPADPRSEEHTSELQSRENLVCRL